MKILLLIPLLLAFTRDPGTGSNPAVGPGPATPDAGSRDTSVMGGGTPGSQGMNTLDINDPNEEQLKIMKEKQEETEKRLEKRDKEKGP